MVQSVQIQFLDSTFHKTILEDYLSQAKIFPNELLVIIIFHYYNFFPDDPGTCTSCATGYYM